MLENTSAFVTGASQGIGRQIAFTLIQKGANVVLAARSDGIYETMEMIESDKVMSVSVDVTDEEAVADGIRKIVDEFGGLDCLVIDYRIPHLRWQLLDSL